MENKDFDQFIKKSLERLEGENILPSDWSLMEQELDAMANTESNTESNDFDQFVKSSMVGLEGENILPKDWSLMEKELDAMANTTSEIDSFDQMIKNSMVDLEGENILPKDWSLMEKELDAAANPSHNAAIEDIYLDGVAYDNLHELKAPYNAEHWEMMSARLDEEYAYRRKVMVTKALEILVMLLLLWTGVNYFPLKKSAPNKSNATEIAKKPAPHQLISPIATNKNKVSNDNDTNTFNQKSKTKTNNSNNALAFNNNTNTSRKSNSIDTEGLATDSAPALAAQSILPTESTIPTSRFEYEEAPQLIASSVIPNIKSNQPNPFPFSIPFNVLDRDLISLIPPLKSLTPPLLEFDKTTAFSIASDLRPKKIGSKFTFSMFSSTDYNQANLLNYNIASNEWKDLFRNEPGYGGGFSVGYKFKYFQIETGAIYSFIQFEPLDQTKYITGSVQEGYSTTNFSNIEINVVQVPLNAIVSIHNHKRWHLYGLTGVSLNMAVQNRFDIEEEGLSPGGKKSASRSPIFEVLDRENQVYGGLLEGGSFNENSYFTANVGIGIERKFSYRWSLFLQPMYRHHFLLFDGFGSDQYKIHSGNLRFGAKVNIR